MSQTERWEQLCEQASQEQDSEKLAKLIEEIKKLLAEKQHTPNQAEKKDPATQGAAGPRQSFQTK